MFRSHFVRSWCLAEKFRAAIIPQATQGFAPIEGARRPVSRVLSAPLRGAGRPFLWDAPCGAPHATNPGDGAGMSLRSRRVACRAAGRPYSVLLPVGFTLPRLLPERRCALTAPFHPCPRRPTPARAVCFLWHFPWGRPRRPLAGTVFPWSPDFPPPGPREHGSGRPTVWRALIATAATPGQGPESAALSTEARSAVSASAWPVMPAGRQRRWKARRSVAKTASPADGAGTG